MRSWNEEMKELRAYGRRGIDETDHYALDFKPKRLSLWSTSEVRNRLNWLRKRKFAGLKDSNKQTITKERIARYAKELFKRESADAQAKARKSFNFKRREKRAKAKADRLRGMAKATQIRLRDKMKSMKSLPTLQL